MRSALLLFLLWWDAAGSWLPARPWPAFAQERTAGELAFERLVLGRTAARHPHVADIDGDGRKDVVGYIDWEKTPDGRHGYIRLKSDLEQVAGVISGLMTKGCGGPGSSR